MAKGKSKPARAEGPTLGQVVTSTGLLAKIQMTTRSIISRSVAEADEQGRVMLRVVSCHTCTAPKACCSLHTAIFFYEALPIAARLIAEGRDTPELRTALRVSAEAMENTPRPVYNRPCVLLDAEERCTVYTDRAAACGVALVYSPAEACSQRGSVDAYTGQLHNELGPKVEEGVRAELGLPDREYRYIGVLPRMVLLALQAWNRADFARFLAQHVPTAAQRLYQAST
jgi:hypothetical protein